MENKTKFNQRDKEEKSKTIKIKKLQMKLDSLDEEVDTFGLRDSTEAVKEYQRILREIDKLNKYI